jgi:proline iminopeptidase
MSSSSHSVAVDVPARRVPNLRGRARLTGLERLRPLLGLGLVALFAALSAVPMPRGPVTSEQALVVMATSLLVGGVAGYLLRSRWALILAPLAYILVYELARLGVRGASLELPRLDSTAGIAAFVAGRGVHGVLALLPMVLGVSIGVAIARRSDENRSLARRVLENLPRGLLALLVVGLAWLVALPATAPPVVDAAGRPVPGSIAELVAVELGGQPQVISVRAADPDKPVLLYLSGGPGQSDLAFSRALLAPLTADFVVVGWDQRGTGKSYAALDPTSQLTLEQAVADTIELTNYLRQRFAEERIYLVGESWGTTLGVLAVQQQPELYHAYLGSGQMVSQRVTDQIVWRDLLAYAERTGDWQLYNQVLTLGEPPYSDMPWANSLVMAYYEPLGGPYQPPKGYIERGAAANLGPFGLLGSEYNLVEKANVLRGLVDMFSIMYPQLQPIDFRADVPRLDVPVYLLNGAHELRGRGELSSQWFEQLVAPYKESITYAAAGHSVLFEAADDIHRLLVEQVVPSTYGMR